jgi:alginate O-acetyltransferase complex protein AlgI
VLFNSPLFVVFFGFVFVLYWALRARTPQNVLLLVASYVFYGAWSRKFLALLIASTVADYVFGLLIGGIADRRRKRLVLILSVVMNLTLLGVFKYAGFFVHEAVELLGWLGFQPHVRTLEIALPIGISFYTFQSLSYVIDVYRGKLPATRSLMEYALYVAFFPQLVAGPIERATHLLPQIKRERVWSGAALESGLQLMVWGLFKKVVIADSLAPYVNAVYAQPAAFSGAALVTATVFFAFQIYGDFSGYSDTARGVARTLGFDLMRNFDAPYFARNPVEFWQRWHISLSRWFQDYLYFPLAIRAMRKGGWASKYRAHIVSMGLIGLWHGANWTFVVWGGLHGLFLLVNHAWRALRGERETSRFRQWCGRILTFFLVVLAWVFFRAETFDAARRMFDGMRGRHGWINGVPVEAPAWFSKLVEFGGVTSAGSAAWLLQLIWCVALLAIVWGLPNTQQFVLGEGRRADARLVLRPTFAWAAVLGLCFGLAFTYSIISVNRVSEFIYFIF